MFLLNSWCVMTIYPQWNSELHFVFVNRLTPEYDITITVYNGSSLDHANEIYSRLVSNYDLANARYSKLSDPADIAIESVGWCDGNEFTHVGIIRRRM